MQSKEVDEELLIDRRERQRRRRNSRNASINEKPKKSDGIDKVKYKIGAKIKTYL